MLKDRLITAAIAIAIVLIALWLLPSWLLVVVFAVVALIAAFEWSRLCGFAETAIVDLPVLGPMGRDAVVFLAAIVLGMLGALALLDYPLVLLIPVVAWWALTLGEVMSGTRVFGRPLGSAIMGWVAIVGCFFALAHLVTAGSNGRWLILCLLLVIWVADSGAYFAGRQFGKTKLAPSLSPGKSVEGVVGGLAAAVVVAIVTGLVLWGGFDKAIFGWTILCVLTALISVLGDLVESREKRAAGVKDSGDILPGHGGMADRIDSLLAGASFFALGMNLPGLAG